MKNELTRIQNMIHEVRGQKVMFDRDLAVLYGVEVKRLNEAIKRNIERFPADFMFQLTQDEWEILRSHFATAKYNVSKVRFLPRVFTEHGVLMLSNVLNSTKAVNISIQIIHAFVQLRQYIVNNSDVSTQIIELRKLLMLYIEKNDKRVNDIILALNNLIEKPSQTKRIGFILG